MPAPQASMMQQLARAKFTSFGLQVPANWQAPPDQDQYDRAFAASEKNTAPGSPPLFQPATMNKYHTDSQKMHIAKIGSFIDGSCSAICSAWSQWQTAATMTGIVVSGPVASVGQIVGPPLMPLIMASAPKASPMELKYSNVIANVISTSWLTFTATVKIPGLPFYPAFAMFPSPVVPPPGVPNVPVPFAALTQVPVSISANAMKGMMVGQLGDPQAPFHSQLFEAICTAFEQCYNTWKATTMVTNVMGLGGVPTYAPPIVPAGPVIGTANMMPGGFA
ncbi:MAG: hypothetical protein R3B48_18935 [Kofleriaceae bacterium]